MVRTQLSLPRGWVQLPGQGTKNNKKRSKERTATEGRGDKIIKELILKHRIKSLRVPGGPVVKTPSWNAGDMGLIPGWRTKIPYTMELSPCTSNRVQVLQEDPACHNKAWTQSNKLNKKIHYLKSK